MASPTRPAPSRATSATTSYLSATDDHQLQQAGRSATNLAAQQSAQALREPAKPPNLLRKKGRAPSPTAPPTSHGPAPNARPASMALAENVSLPNASSSASLRTSAEDAGSSSSWSSPGPSQDQGLGHGHGRGAPASATATPAGAAALAAEMRARTPSGSGSGAQTPNLRMPLLPDLLHNASSLSLSRQTTPRTVRDLGADYTRYYNPFATHANSRNTSHSDLATTLPRYNSSTHLAPAVPSADLHKRLSDPFHDPRSSSDHVDAPPASTPSTPLQRRPSQDREHMAAALVAAPAAAASIVKPGTPSFIRDADPEKAPFFPYLDDRLGAPSYDFPLFTDEKEDDDDMHMPLWDDDVRLKPRFKDHFNRENIASTLGMMFMISGLLCVFVVLPIVSFTGPGLINYGDETPLDQMGGPSDSQAWATVNDVKYPLLSNLRSSLIDADTPNSAQTRQGVNGDQYNLVFSDEFNVPNRTFYPGDDPYWYAFDGWYGATQDLEWYDPDAANTGDGTLLLQLDAFENHNLAYRSAMLHSWNQLCFKGGIFEVSMSLPGPAGVHGWWPGAWTMGNLGRPGYLATTDGMWPYTYNTCDAGITPNQSMTDGTSHLPGQRLPSCSCANEDHPTPGTGRGAPEIDIAEASGDWGGQGWGVATQSYQVAPFDIFYYPNYDFMETPDYNLSFVNTYTGGPYQQAVSTTSMLNNNWYDGNEYQKYAFEYVPGDDENAYIAWIIGEQETMRFDARAIGPNGNVGQRLISEEPMSMILNFGFSNSWVDIDWAALRFPAVMRIDYVRWYQKEGEEMVTCDPPGYETTAYIANHSEAYNNVNLTKWADAGYSWPTNTLMNGCAA